MRWLCIDTSSGADVAVVLPGTVGRAHDDDPRAHAEGLAQLIESALRRAQLPSSAREANLDAVVVGTGPAPFTGLRAGLITARVLARSCGIKIYGLASLEILARAALDELAGDLEVVVVTDARRKEVYWARYRAAGPNGVRALDAPAVGDPVAVANRFADREVIFAGPGCAAYPQVFANPMNTRSVDAAVAVRVVEARRQRGEDDFSTEPLYLRRPDIHPGGSGVGAV